MNFVVLGEENQSLWHDKAILWQQIRRQLCSRLFRKFVLAVGSNPGISRSRSRKTSTLFFFSSSQSSLMVITVLKHYTGNWVLHIACAFKLFQPSQTQNASSLARKVESLLAVVRLQRKCLPLATCVGSRGRNATIWMNGSCDNVRINEAFLNFLASPRCNSGWETQLLPSLGPQGVCVTSSCCLSAPRCVSHMESSADNKHVHTHRHF